MAEYSVAKAKDGLSSLIAKAQAGEEVIITSHGKPVVRLVPAGRPRASSTATYEWLKKRRDDDVAIGMSSVELLNLVYEDYKY